MASPSDEDPSFRMTVAYLYTMPGRGTAVIGEVESGLVSVWDTVHVEGLHDSEKAVVADIMETGKRLERAHEGRMVTLFLHGISRRDVQVGDVLT